MTASGPTELLGSPLGSDFWADETPVLQDHYLEVDYPVPCFGVQDRWDLRALGYSPTYGPSAAAIGFAGLGQQWNLRARELSMAMLNPTHEVVRSAAVFGSSVHGHPKTVNMKIAALKAFAAWLSRYRPDQGLAEVTQHDLDQYLTDRRQSSAASSVAQSVYMLRDLHTFQSLLTGGGLVFRPWGAVSASKLAARPAAGELTTPVIPPATWWPLLRASWQFIDVFSHDIFAAEQAWTALSSDGVFRKRSTSVDDEVRDWLASEDGNVPIHRANSGGGRAGAINWNLLSMLVTQGRTGTAFSQPGASLGAARRRLVNEAVESGRIKVRTGGIPVAITQVTRLDGSYGPWIDGFDPATIGKLRTLLRDACYIFCAALTMMRDSELQSIRKGGVTTHYGAPAVQSRLWKGQRGVHVRNWWIIEPVAQAIAVAERLALGDVVFAGTRRNPAQPERVCSFDQKDELGRFIARVNALGPASGLDPIPETHLAPHMFRRTMAIIAGQQPDGEIALGLQLKHAARRALANATTTGYAHETPEWAREFEHELQEAVAARLVGLWSQGTSEPLQLAGAGAQRLRDAFESATAAARNASPVKIGDDRLLRSLLRDRFSTFRWGTINHCLGIAEQAACLVGLPRDAADQGMLPNRCRPTTCRNSVITTDHLPIWIAEEKDLISKLKDRRMAPDTRAQLESELRTVQHVTQRLSHA